MFQELFFESFKDADLAVKLINRNHPDGYFDSFDDVQSDIKAWFGEKLYNYTLITTHRKYEWIDSVVLNSYRISREVRNTYIDRMIFSIGEDSRGIEYQLAPVLVDEQGHVYDTEDNEVTIFEDRFEFYCNGDIVKMCVYALKPRYDMKETTEYKIVDTQGYEIEQ